ncbi:MAG: putative polysaccharide biosynthesis protein [Bacillota bacterium]|jgi:stage V sporulation protein B
MAKKHQGLLLGTILLIFSNIYIKGLGFLYRVVLVRVLGAEGIGLIEMVTPLYSFLLVLASWGVPLAISQSIASSKNNRGEILNIFKSGLIVLFITGVIVTLASWLLLPYMIEYFVPDERIYLSLLIMLPAVFIISIDSAFRGYFQGMGQISSIGASQSIEQTVRVLVGIFLAFQLANLSLDKSVTSAAIGTLLGETAGFIYLLKIFNKQQRGEGSGFFRPRMAKNLVRFGTPVTLNRLVLSSMMMLQAFLIPMALQHAGYDMRTATEMYGRFAGVAMTLLHLPGVFTSALSVSVIPAIAECSLMNKKLLAHRISNSLQATIVFSLPGMLILFLFADQFCTWIFNSPLSAHCLRILCLGGTFAYLQVTLTSILQGLGKVKELLINAVMTGVCLLGGILLLTAHPSLGIDGAAIAVNISCIFGFALNFLCLFRVTRIKLPLKNIFFKPIIATFFTLIAFMGLGPLVGDLFSGQEKMALAAIIFLLLIIYFVALALMGGLSMGIWRRMIRR